MENSLQGSDICGPIPKSESNRLSANDALGMVEHYE